jgi:hypothetical protein
MAIGACEGGDRFSARRRRARSCRQADLACGPFGRPRGQNGRFSSTWARAGGTFARMERLAAHREQETVRGEEPAPAAAPVLPGSLQWASAVGNAAVQRLARQEAEVAEPEATEAAGPEEEAAEAPPPEVAAMEQAGIGPEAVAGLEAVDELGDDALPE